MATTWTKRAPPPTMWSKRNPPRMDAFGGSHLWVTRAGARILGNNYTFTQRFIPLASEDKVYVFGKLKYGQLVLTLINEDTLDTNVPQTFISNDGSLNEINLWADMTNMTINEPARIQVQALVSTGEQFELLGWGILYAQKGSGWTKRIPLATVWTKRII